MTLTDFQRRAIGVPFVEDGRDYTGWDCWGLVMAAYRDVLGVTLPDYGPNGAHTARALLRQFTQRECSFWQRSDPAPMAVACIFRRGRVIHAGLVVPRRYIMHVEQGVETCMEPVKDFRIEGFYVPAGGNPTPV